MQGAPFTSFTMRTCAEVVKVAGAEYEASIEDGRFHQARRVQDSRGFVLYAEQLLVAQRTDFEMIDRAAFGEVVQALAAVKVAWPAPVTPTQPVMAAGELSSRLDAIAKRAERFF